MNFWLMELTEISLGRWQNTYKSIARTHYKSTNLRKLDAAVSVYAGLATVDFVRKAALDKLASMLLHPFPKACLLFSNVAVSVRLIRES